MNEIITKLGSVALHVRAEAIPSALADIAKLALQNLIFHKAPSIAYKKGSGFKREDSFSPELAEQMKSAVKSALMPYFKDISVEASLYVAPEPKADAVAAERRKAFDAMVKLDRSIAESLYPEFAEKAEDEEVVD